MKNNKKIINSANRTLSRELSSIKNLKSTLNNNFCDVVNLIYNTTFTDIYCCYIFFKRDLISSDNLKSKGFEQHAEILCKLVKKGNKFFEVPVNYNGRTISEGKKIRFYHIFI